LSNEVERHNIMGGGAGRLHLRKACFLLASAVFLLPKNSRARFVKFSETELTTQD